MQTKYQIGDIICHSDEPELIMLIENIDSVILSNSDGERQISIYEFRNLTKNQIYRIRANYFDGDLKLIKVA
jgi:hypothetical protein